MIHYDFIDKPSRYIQIHYKIFMIHSTEATNIRDSPKLHSNTLKTYLIYANYIDIHSNYFQIHCASFKLNLNACINNNDTLKYIHQTFKYSYKHLL